MLKLSIGAGGSVDALMVGSVILHGHTGPP